MQPLTWLAGLLAAYVAQVAHWLGAPGWAQVEVSTDGPGSVVAAYAAIVLCAWVALGWAARRRGLRSWPGRHTVVAAATAVALVAFSIGRPAVDPGAVVGPAPGLRITVLDVGQGDSILLDPADGEPVLVDGGPHGDDLRDHLEREGVSKLAAVVVTHDQSDHVGGIEELLGILPIHRLLYAQRGPDFPRNARAADIRTSSIAEGSEVDSGGLRLEVLWPPRAALDHRAPTDPNLMALVLLARWHRFSMLLTADAEAEAVPLDPGPVDVLKVAHHGSDDAGLGPLLDRTAPEPGRDLGRCRQPLRPPDAGYPFHPRGAWCPNPPYGRGGRCDDRRHARRLDGRDGGWLRRAGPPVWSAPSSTLPDLGNQPEGQR